MRQPLQPTKLYWLFEGPLTTRAFVDQDPPVWSRKYGAKNCSSLDGFRECTPVHEGPHGTPKTTGLAAWSSKNALPAPPVASVPCYTLEDDHGLGTRTPSGVVGPADGLPAGRSPARPEAGEAKAFRPRS